MAIAAEISAPTVAWWREPTKDQWLAWIAASLGWMLDAFDFTIFLLLMASIAEEFGVSVTAVASVLTFTLWLRLMGAVGAGWLADRIGRKTPLILSIVWFSACNFIAGFSPSFTFLFVVRTILGIGMGAEWPAGASLAMESWPARSRGLMGGLLQGTWGIGFALSGLAYWLLLDAIGWRGLLWLAALPAPIVCAYIHYCVKEPEVWVENRKRQRQEKKEVRAPLVSLFKPALLANTLSACWWVASVMIVYYSITGLFATWLQTDLKLTAALVTMPIVLSSLLVLAGEAFWCRVADGIGRRGAIIIQAAIACIVAPVYLLTDDLTWIVIGFVVQGAFGTSLPGLTPAYLTERFPTEVRQRLLLSCRHRHCCARPARHFLFGRRAAHRLCGADADRHSGGLGQRHPCLAGQPGDERQSVRFRLDDALRTRREISESPVHGAPHPEPSLLLAMASLCRLKLTCARHVPMSFACAVR